MSYQRKIEDIRRLKSLYDKTKNSYIAGVWYDKDKNRYYRYSCNIKSEKVICKRRTRRKLKGRNYILQRGQYKKVHEYKWMII